MKPFSAEDSAQTQTLPRTSGFLVGSKILTLDGELPVEHLCVGDRVITRDTGMAVLQAIHVTQTECNLVAIAKGALGQNSPLADISVPVDQQILLRGWRAVALTGKKQVLSAVGSLTNNEFICPVGLKRVRLFSLTFAKPHILYVDGLEMECSCQKATLRAAA